MPSRDFVFGYIISPVVSFLNSNWNLSPFQLSAGFDMLSPRQLTLAEKHCPFMDDISTHATSPRELILQTRLEKVKKLLANHAMKIDSIAAQCGFSSANRLSHLFKERFKVTMREYRAASTAVRR